MTVGKPTAHSDHLGWYILGLEICQGVPNAYLGLTEWADQRMKNVKVALGVSPQFFSIWTRVLNHNKYVEIKQFFQKRHQTK